MVTGVQPLREPACLQPAGLLSQHLGSAANGDMCWSCSSLGEGDCAGPPGSEAVVSRFQERLGHSRQLFRIPILFH